MRAASQATEWHATALELIPFPKVLPELQAMGASYILQQTSDVVSLG